MTSFFPYYFRLANNSGKPISSVAPVFSNHNGSNIEPPTTTSTPVLSTSAGAQTRTQDPNGVGQQQPSLPPKPGNAGSNSPPPYVPAPPPVSSSTGKFIQESIISMNLNFPARKMCQCNERTHGLRVFLKIICLNLRQLTTHLEKNWREFWIAWNIGTVKVHIFWEGHKILRNLHLTFALRSASQK